MNQVVINRIERDLPSQWNELSDKQLVFICGLFARKISVIDFKVSALFSFLHIKASLFKRIHGEDAYFLCKSLDFLLSDITLTRNLLPVIRTRLRSLYGPSDRLSQCTFGEFTRAHTFFERYLQTKSSTDLDGLVGVLYRPQKVGWTVRKRFTDSSDRRVKLKDRTLQQRIRMIRRVDPEIKYAVFLFFSGCLAWLPRQFPNLYRKKEDAPSVSGGWIPMIISLADGRTDNPSLDLVVDSNLYNVFLGLEQKSIEYFDYLDKLKRK